MNYSTLSFQKRERQGWGSLVVFTANPAWRQRRVALRPELRVIDIVIPRE